MIWHLGIYKENKPYHVKWCKNKNCKKCKEYVQYIQEHYSDSYDSYLKNSINWEKFKV